MTPSDRGVWHVAAPSPAVFVPSEGEGAVSRRIGRLPRRVVGSEGATVVWWEGDLPVVVVVVGRGRAGTAARL
jgi:hypothetical protein